jgi:hypothetical protein
MISNVTLVPEAGSFIHGFAGLTPQLVLSGEVHFEASRDTEILYFDVLFKGLVRTVINVSSLKFTQEEVIYDMSSRLVNGDPPEKYEKGTHVIPFKLVIDHPVELSNYASPALGDKVKDGGFITYDLQVEIQYKGGLFGNKKITESVSEPINIPSVKWEQVLAALKPQVLEFEEIIGNDKVQIRFDKHAIHVGSELNVKINTSGSAEFLKAELIQIETVSCQGQIRKFDYLLAESASVKSASAQRFGKSKIPANSSISFDLRLPSARIKKSKSYWKSVDVVTAFNHEMISISHVLKATFTISGKIEQALLPILVLDLDDMALESLGHLVE